MNKGEVAVSVLPVHLAHGFKERHTLDIADGSSDFNDTDFCVVAFFVSPGLGCSLDSVLNLVGDVRDNLDSGSQVVAVAFLGDDGLIDFSGG